MVIPYPKPFGHPPLWTLGSLRSIETLEDEGYDIGKSYSSQSCTSWTGASLCSVIDVLGYGFLAITIWASSLVEPLIMEIDGLDWGREDWGHPMGRSSQNTTSGAKWLWMGCWGFHLAFITTCPGPVLPTQLPCHMQFILQDLVHCHDFWAPGPLVIIMWLDNPWLFGKRL